MHTGDVLTAGTVAQHYDSQRRPSMLRKRGATWSDIGAALDTSRQAAWERFSDED